MKHRKTKPLIRYRFKDSMGYVFFKVFNTDREAVLWFEQNKSKNMIREYEKMGLCYKSNFLYSNQD